MRWILVALVAGLALPGVPEVVAETAAAYPDLRSLPPYDLRLGSETVDGSTHGVLRFSAAIWNAGQGPLELRGEAAGERTRVYQRIYADGAVAAEQPVGDFSYDEDHR